MSMSKRASHRQVTGQFDHPEGDVRRALAKDQPHHDRTAAAFTADGTLTYTSSLTRFVFRYLIEVHEDSAVEADAIAVLIAEVRTQDYLEAHDIATKSVRTSATCLQDVKVRRPKVHRTR